MIRKAFVMQVNADAHEEYQRRHNPIWPELEAVLKSHGAHHYAIYLDQERNLLFATVEIESEERWNTVAVGRNRRLRRHPAISILLRYQDSLSIRFQRFKDMRLVAGITNVIALRQLFRRLG